MTNPTAPPMDEDVSSGPKDQASIVAAKDPVTGTDAPIPPPRLSSLTQEDVNGIQGAETAKDVVENLEIVTETLKVVAVDPVEEQNDAEETVTDASRTLPIEDTNEPGDGISGTDLASFVKLMTQEDVETNELMHKEAAPISASRRFLVTQEDEDAKDIVESIEDLTKLDVVAVEPDEKQKDVEEAVSDAETLPIEDTDGLDETGISD